MQQDDPKCEPHLFIIIDPRAANDEPNRRPSVLSVYSLQMHIQF